MINATQVKKIMIKELKIKQILLHGEAKADRNNKFKS